MLDFTKLWDKRYLLGPNPVDFVRSDYIFFWTSLVFMLAGMIAKAFAIKQEEGSPKKFLFGRLFHLFLTMGILILVWAAARYENIPWVSTHIVVLGILAIWAVWLGFMTKYFFGLYRQQQQRWTEDQLKLKYLKQ